MLGDEIGDEYLSTAVPENNQGGTNIIPVPVQVQNHHVELRIHNVLALALLVTDRKYELDEAIKLFKNAIYNPDFFPALRIEVVGPYTKSLYTVSLFDGGRIQSAGGCMPREAGVCMKQVARRLRDKLGLQVQFKNFEVHNLLAVVDTNSRIDLRKLFMLAPGQKDFEPHKFPTLRITLPVPQSRGGQGQQAEEKKTALDKKREAARLSHKEKHHKQETITASVFANGKINFVGGKSVKSIMAILEELRPFIEACT